MGNSEIDALLNPQPPEDHRHYIHYHYHHPSHHQMGLIDPQPVRASQSYPVVLQQDRQQHQQVSPRGRVGSVSDYRHDPYYDAVSPGYDSVADDAGLSRL